MTSLAVTIPVSLFLGAFFLWIVIREIRNGTFDDWDGPAERMIFDDDDVPERDGGRTREEP